MKTYLFVYTNGIIIANETVFSDSSFDIIIDKFRVEHEGCQILNIIDLESDTNLTKDILDKNFEINMYDYEHYFKDANLIPYKVEVPQASSIIHTWNLIFNEDTGILTIEDDPLLRITTVKELKFILKMSGINKEIKW